MIRHSQLLMFLAAGGLAASVSGCGQTLVFAEREGVNFAVRTNAASSTPIEVNFGLNRQVASVVPPAGQVGDKPDGDAVNMFAGFQVDNTLDTTKPLNANMQISTQFASGQAATAVANNAPVVAMIVDVGSGAKLAARVNAEAGVIIAAISCNGKLLVPLLRDKLIDAAALPPDFSAHLKTMQTADELTTAIGGSPGLVRRLQTAATKQGRATCSNQ